MILDGMSLFMAIEKRFGGNKETKKVHKTLLKQQYENFSGSSSESLDQIHDRLQKLISQLEILGESLSPEDINLSTNESVSAVASLFAASTKVLVSALPNVDNLSDAIDRKWQMAMLTMRARRFLQRTGRNIGANGTTSIGFDMSKVECYNFHRRRHFIRECRSPKDIKNKDTQRRNVPVETSTSNAFHNVMVLVAMIGAFRQIKNQPIMPSWHFSPQVQQVLQVLTVCLESVEARLVVYQQNENVYEENIKLLKLDVMLRENDLVELKKKFEKAEQERDELKLKLEKFQTSLKNLSKLLASQILDKTRLGYANQVFNSTVFDCDELISFESDVSMPTSLMHDRYKSGEGYHAVPPPYTGTFMPLKPDLVFHDASTVSETVPTIINVEPKDESEGEPLSTQKVPSFVQTTEHVKTPRTSVKSIEHSIPAEDLRKDISNSRGPIHSWNRKACNPQHALKDKGVIDSGFSRHMTGNISYLFDFEEINEGYVAFGGNPKGCKITSKGIKREFSVARTPQQNGIAERNNRTLIEAVRTMLADSLYPFQFGLRQLILPAMSKIGNQPNSSVGIQENFNADTVGKEARSVQQYVLLPLWSSRSKDPQNTNATAFEVKEPESKVYVSPNSSDKTKKHDAKTKREDKGKSPVEFTPITAVGPNLTNITNNFSAAGPSNTAISLTFNIGGKSSFVDPSTYPDDLNMPDLENITYSDDEEDVGAEADFSNLETSLTVSPIPTTRVHKDHPVTQIIGDLSSAPLTRSMKRMVKDHGGLTQINDEEFHTCMFACFLSQEEPKRVHQALKDSSWIEAIQEEHLQFKMQNVWGHTQEKGIYYEEVFTLVAMIETIRLFLAYASFMGFMVYQMDVKSAFLYETIEEEVYVCQPPGFEDPDYPNKVYKVFKALYELHQAPRAWYETLANYLLENGFQKGQINQTLFIKKQKGDILQVKVYVDDIIFGSTNKGLCKAFEKLMKDKFKMRKFGLTNRKSAKTPIDTEKPLLKDPDGEDVDVHTYRSMIGSLMYLTLSRPDIMFAICACAHFQVTPKASHLHAVKKIFSDYTGASLDRRSTTGGFGDVSSHTTNYTSLALTQKVFANMRRIGKGFSRVATPLFDGMLVPQQARNVKDAAEDANDDTEVFVEPTPPSPTPATTPPPPRPQQELIPSPPQTASTLLPSHHQAQTAQPSSPPPQQTSQPDDLSKSAMTLLN
nr:hypothetical protein [Tanacetum cinerariifolium]